MKTIVIPNIEYTQFAIYKDAIDEHTPWALYRDSYNKRTKKAIFSFNDSSYIPPCLNRYIANIEGNKALVGKVNEQIINELLKVK